MPKPRIREAWTRGLERVGGRVGRRPGSQASDAPRGTAGGSRTSVGSVSDVGRPWKHRAGLQAVGCGLRAEDEGEGEGAGDASGRAMGTGTKAKARCGGGGERRG